LLSVASVIVVYRLYRINDMRITKKMFVVRSWESFYGTHQQYCCRFVNIGG